MQSTGDSMESRVTGFEARLNFSKWEVRQGELLRYREVLILELMGQLGPCELCMKANQIKVVESLG